MGSVEPLFPKRKTVSSAHPTPPGSPRAAAAAVATPLPSTGGRRGEYAIGDVARPLGLSHFAVRTIIDKLRVLAKHDGMPLPRTPRIVDHKPVTGPESIYCKSRWDAGEFDAWLDDRRPSGPAGALPPVPQPVRDAMRARALQIANVA